MGCGRQEENERGRVEEEPGTGENERKKRAVLEGPHVGHMSSTCRAHVVHVSYFTLAPLSHCFGRNRVKSVKWQNAPNGKMHQMTKCVKWPGVSATLVAIPPKTPDFGACCVEKVSLCATSSFLLQTRQSKKNDGLRGPFGPLCKQTPTKFTPP